MVVIVVDIIIHIAIHIILIIIAINVIGIVVIDRIYVIIIQVTSHAVRGAVM